MPCCRGIWGFSTKTGAEVFCGRHLLHTMYSVRLACTLMDPLQLTSVGTACNNGRGEIGNMLGRRMQMLCNHSILFSRAVSALKFVKSWGRGGPKIGNSLPNRSGQSRDIQRRTVCKFFILLAPSRSVNPSLFSTWATQPFQLGLSTGFSSVVPSLRFSG